MCSDLPPSLDPPGVSHQIRLRVSRGAGLNFFLMLWVQITWVPQNSRPRALERPYDWSAMRQVRPWTIWSCGIHSAPELFSHAVSTPPLNLGPWPQLVCLIWRLATPPGMRYAMMPRHRLAMRSVAPGLTPRHVSFLAYGSRRVPCLGAW